MSNIEEMNATGGLREGEEEQVDRGDMSVRKRVPTDKGKQYQVSKTEERVESSRRKWSKVASKIRKTLKAVFNPFDLQSLSGEEKELFDQLCMEYSKLIELEPKRSEELNEDLEHNQRVHHEIAESIDDRMRELKSDKGSVGSSKQSRRSRVSAASSRSSVQRKREAAATVARLKREMEYHDSLAEAEATLAKERAETEATLAKERAEAEASLAKERAEAEIMLTRKQAMLSKKIKERDLAVASAELNALYLVEEEEAEMLPNDDESVGKQEYLQQYIVSK